VARGAPGPRDRADPDARRGRRARCAFPTIRDPSEADVAHWQALYVTELRDLHREFRNDPPLTIV
jgi:hypothetical protein